MLDFESFAGFISMIISDAKKSRASGECPMCKTKVSESEFRDEISKREYKISGMCLNCQHKSFNEKGD